MDSSLISLIVPVYQVEDYLEDCINSLLAQTYKNIEILLIDDGSADGCGRICDAYAGKDARVRVVHQENQGTSAARNTGMRLARGEYIGFVDADDCLSPVFVEELYALICRHHADIAACTYTRDWESVPKTMQGAPSGICLEAQQILKEWHGKRKQIETSVCNKLYKKSILLHDTHPILFPEGTRYEDVYVSHLMVQNAGKVAITERALYMYRVRSGSLKQSRITKEKACQNVKAQMARLDFFRENGMKASSRRLAKGFFLHLLMFEWKLKGKWDPPVRKRELLKYLIDAMM